MWSASRMFWYFLAYLSPVVAWLMVMLLVVRPARLRCRTQVALGVLLAALVAKRFWFWMFGGHPVYPDLPEFVCHLCGWGYVFVVLLAVLAIFPPYRRWRVRAVAFTCGAAFLAIWGTFESLRLPAVNRHEIIVEGLPPAFDGMRIAHVSDIHCSPSTRLSYVRGVVDRVNALKPDLVCLTGDFVDGTPAMRAADLEPLADLRAKWGVLGCSGNHEFYSGYHRWRPIFQRLGIHMLDNACVVITNGEDRLAVGGVVDPVGAKKFMDGKKGKALKDARGFPRRRWPKPNVQAAFADAPPSACRILLAHRPTDLPEHAAAGVRLQLSGHTHGGVLWPSYPLVSLLNDRHVNGLYREDGIALYVTAGAGQWIGFPVRLGIPTEIALLTLRAPKR